VNELLVEAVRGWKTISDGVGRTLGVKWVGGGGVDRQG